MKKLIMMLLAVVVAFSVSSSAFTADAECIPGEGPADRALIFDPTKASVSETADRSGKIPMEGPADVELIFDAAKAQIMEESFLRGAKIPTDMYNLDGQSYNVEGQFKTTIYTEYYFYPSADGKLYYNFSFTWLDSCGTQRVAGIELWDKVTGEKVIDKSFEMRDNGNGTFGPAIATGNRQIYNLNPTHGYYFHLTKSFDGISADVEGVIST